jgi:hypothetical protein
MKNYMKNNKDAFALCLTCTCFEQFVDWQKLIDTGLEHQVEMAQIKPKQSDPLHSQKNIQI